MLTDIKHPASLISIRNLKLIINQPVILNRPKPSVFLFDNTKESSIISGDFKVYILKKPFEEAIKDVRFKENKYYSHDLIYLFNILPCAECYGIGKTNIVDDITNGPSRRIFSTDHIYKERGTSSKPILCIENDLKYFYYPPSRTVKHYNYLCPMCKGTGINKLNKFIKDKPLIKVIESLNN
jgi:hypothetical protein